MIKMKVEGLKELDDALSDLSLRHQKGIVRKALREAAEPIAEDARSKVAADSYHGGELLESIAVSTRLNRRQARQQRRQSQDFATVYVGPGERGPHGHLLEFGTAHSAPEPFMRPAFEANKMRAIDIIKKTLWEGIQRRVRLNARAAAKAQK